MLKYWFTGETGTDKINTAAPFRAPEIVVTSGYVVHLIFPQNNMYYFFSSSEENHWSAPW